MRRSARAGCVDFQDAAWCKTLPKMSPAEEAYARMRRTAMNEKNKIAEIAPSTVAAAEPAK